jgi:hypothetical protein
MRCTILFAIFTAMLNSTHGQTEFQHARILWSENDSFSVRFSNSSWNPSFRISKTDTLDAGTSGAINLKATIFFGKDSLVIPYKRLPGLQVHFIPLQSPKGKTIYRLHFNAVHSAFSPQYIRENSGKVEIKIPEVYELANVLWLLSPSGQRANNLNKEGRYYENVVRYFKPFLNHPVFKKLDFPDSIYYQQYYDFRDNSLSFHFSKNKLVYGGPYYYVFGNDREFNSLFKELVPLIGDFAARSNFRKFFSNNKEYYEAQIKREQQLVPIQKMWVWLETQFPKIKYNSYKIIFSPLIKSSHSTQNFATYHHAWYEETVMFVCGPEIYDSKKELTEDQKKGILSGIVFTEIDHNYVNPTSTKYSKLIDTIFSKRAAWVNRQGDTKFYDSPMAVFNEYMTHAVFCLYVTDNFDSVTAEFIIGKRESLMVETRQYIKFKEFNQALAKIREENKDATVSELFDEILEWSRKQ